MTYADLYGDARSPWTEQMFTTRPQPRAYMCGRAARTSRNGASSISRRMSEKRSGGNSVQRRDVLQAGVVDQHVDVQIQRSTASRSDRSTVTAWPPTSSATVLAPSASRSTTITEAPAAASRTAQARPMPTRPR